MNEKRGTQPTILLLEQDDETRPLLKYNLNRQGYRVILVLNEEDAIERVRDGRDSPDLILLNQVKSSPKECANAGRHIRQSAGLPGDTPIVVMAEGYGEDMEGQDVRVGENEYITYLEDGQQLIDLLHRLCRGDR
jgi:DNA-binding response OmpR family regulator